MTREVVKELAALQLSLVALYLWAGELARLMI